MYVRKDKIVSIDEYLKDIQDMQNSQLNHDHADTLYALEQIALDMKKKPFEYVWVWP